MSKYKKYKLCELFDIVGTKSLDAGTLTFKDSGINFIGRTDENNGIQGKIERQSFEPNEAKTITATVIGNYKYVKFQEEEYYCSQNINKLSIKPEFGYVLNHMSALYLISHIRKFVELYNGQQGGYKLDELKSFEINIPVTSEDKPDFKFMEQFVARIKRERINKLDIFLKATGLNDYALNQNEADSLKAKRNYKEFKIVDLFEVKNTHSIMQSQVKEASGNIPYLTAAEGNNSVATYISCDKEWVDEGNCIFIGGKTMTITYQEDDFCSNDSHNLALYLKDKKQCEKYVLLFIVTALKKTLGSKYYWGDSISKKKIQSDTVFLPVDKNGCVDYEYMKNYIVAIEKNVIAEVVRFKDALNDNIYATIV